MREGCQKVYLEYIVACNERFINVLTFIGHTRRCGRGALPPDPEVPEDLPVSVVLVDGPRSLNLSDAATPGRTDIPAASPLYSGACEPSCGEAGGSSLDEHPRDSRSQRERERQLHTSRTGVAPVREASSELESELEPRALTLDEMRRGNSHELSELLAPLRLIGSWLPRAR